MSYIPIASFRRPVECVHLDRSRMAEAELPPSGIDKWAVLRELSAARTTFALSDRAVTVLQVLLSFHPETVLDGETGDLVVFPSNAAICARLNGMPCSTMRRHLAALVASGLILRRDSPNGKRFKRRGQGDAEAYGFDLRPLLLRHAEICAEAETARAHAEALARLRRKVSLMRRDLAGLAEYGAGLWPGLALWEDLAAQSQNAARTLRRVLTIADLESLAADLLAALDAARDTLETRDNGLQTEESSTSHSLSEQHKQYSNIDYTDPEPAKRMAQAGAADPACETHAPNDEAGKLENGEDRPLPNIPLGLVLSVCREVQSYVPDRLRHWHDLVRAAEMLRPMIGVSPTAWEEAVEAMGHAETAVVLVAMLERLSEIRSPGGYLRTLARRARDGTFSCGPMVMALTHKEPA